MDELEELRLKKMKEIMEKALKDAQNQNKTQIDSPQHADSRNFDELVSKNTNVVADFWAEWCGPCRMVAPIVDELAKEYAGKVLFLKVNTDQNPKLAARFGITAIPTLLFFKNGRVVDRVVGALPKRDLKRWIEKNI
ncbi:MAG: thioredoxin [Archaeoglobales archaeon]|nr:thioredoxin [Archaeoglobales archaeon]